ICKNQEYLCPTHGKRKASEASVQLQRCGEGKASRRQHHAAARRYNRGALERAYEDATCDDTGFDSSIGGARRRCVGTRARYADRREAEARRQILRPGWRRRGEPKTSAKNA